jgi:tripartite-type tricarboxylate transporter receptor subunit TctC
MAYVAPAGTPDAIIAKLNAAMTDILKEPDVVESLHKQGFDPEPGPPATVTTRIRNEIERWRELVTKIGIKPE